ncbi:MAG: hypothetical protein MI861_22150 [Pirellulales bacterium]|nr:hypothetical protein [Pirellulales bacterium]
MNFPKLSLALMMLLIAFGMQRASFAALILDFSADGSVTEFTVNPGETVEIPIFLRQVGPGPFMPDLTSDGLIGFGIEVDLTDTPGSSTSTGFSISSPFIDLTNNSMAGPSNLKLFGDSLFGVTGSSFELARITVLGNTAGNVTNITLGDPNPGIMQDFGTLAFGGIDSQVFATSATTSVTVVPEPASWLILTAFSAVLLVRRKGRKGRFGRIVGGHELALR